MASVHTGTVTVCNLQQNNEICRDIQVSNLGRINKAAQLEETFVRNVKTNLQDDGTGQVAGCGTSPLTEQTSSYAL